MLKTSSTTQKEDKREETKKLSTDSDLPNLQLPVGPEEATLPSEVPPLPIKELVPGPEPKREPADRRLRHLHLERIADAALEASELANAAAREDGRSFGLQHTRAAVYDRAVAAIHNLNEALHNAGKANTLITSYENLKYTIETDLAREMASKPKERE